MHELSAARKVIEIVREESVKNGIRPRKVVCVMGGLSSYKADPVVFYFDMLKKDDGVVSGCLIEVCEVPAVVRCGACGRESEVEDGLIALCRHCGSTDVNVVYGDDFFVKEIQGE